MSNVKTENPVPPPVPSVDRVTGEVTFKRPEDVGHLDGWNFSEDPYEGGLTAVNRFNDAGESASAKQKAVDEFHKKPNSVI
jgi:hypothetical protein